MNDGVSQSNLERHDPLLYMQEDSDPDTVPEELEPFAGGDQPSVLRLENGRGRPP